MGAVGERRRSARRAARRAGSRRRGRGPAPSVSNSVSTTIGASPSDGSSSSSTSGRAISARAIASCCCWPPESEPGLAAARTRRRPGRATVHPVEVVGDPVRRAPRRRGRAAGSPRRSASRRCGGPRGRARRPARATSSGWPRSGAPRSRISPPASGTTPMIAWSVVDLPAPFGPISPTISPRPSCRLEVAHGRDGRRSGPRPRAARAPAAPLSHRPPRPRGAGAEVGGRDVEVAPDLGGRALRERAAAVEHVDAVADLHDQRDVVVDQQHAGAEVVADGADDRRERRDLGLVQARPPARPSARSAAAARARARRRACARRRAGAAPARSARRGRRGRAARAARRRGRRASRGERADPERRDLDVLAHASARGTAGRAGTSARARRGRGGAAASA